MLYETRLKSAFPAKVADCVNIYPQCVLFGADVECIFLGQEFKFSINQWNLCKEYNGCIV